MKANPKCSWCGRATSDEQKAACIAEWIEEVAKDIAGRGAVTVVQMPDGRRFRVTVAVDLHADEIHDRAMKRVLRQIVREP